jgi:hypothetical protein
MKASGTRSKFSLDREDVGRYLRMFRWRIRYQPQEIKYGIFPIVATYYENLRGPSLTEERQENK